MNMNQFPYSHYLSLSLLDNWGSLIEISLMSFKRHTFDGSREDLTTKNYRQSSTDDFYPFKYENYEELEEYQNNNLEIEETPTAAPRIGSKIDEFFDSYLEDSLFRLFYPQPLKYSPLSIKLNLLFNSKNGIQVAFIPKGSLSYALFGPESNSFLEWQSTLYQESLLDAGINTPADYITNSELSHRHNRRSVYQAANRINELSTIRSGRLRVFWRYFCHFSIYFVKGLFAGFGMYTTNRYLKSNFQ